jgi:A/G-specific adenine glycosylase
MINGRQLTGIVQPLLAWYGQNARDLPWRHTSDPYSIWISEIMLQQTQVTTVIPYWERWMREFPTVDALAAADLASVLKCWEGLGYYSRARNLRQAADIVVRHFHGRIPERREDLLSLPGIGRYTAGAIGSIAFNQPVPVLDGNIIRVLTRLYGIAENPRQRGVNERLWTLAESLVSEAGRLRRRGRKTCADLNQSLMELGALICGPRQPRCPDCPLQSQCAARREGQPNRYPVIPPKRPMVRCQWFCFLAECQGRYLLCQRTSQKVNSGLWEFPTCEIENPAVTQPEEAARQIFGAPPQRLELVGQLRHNITHHQIRIRTYRLVYKSPPRGRFDGQWLRLEEVDRRPLAGAHKKIRRLFLP